MSNTQHIKRDPAKIKELLSLNFDSRQYFFSKADGTWLEWLWTNGLLDEIKKKAENPNEYSYRLPELEYLTRMAEVDPNVVADIIEAVSISKDTFNPEVIDRFLWILGLLPAEQIKRLIPKVLTENWPNLMSRFGKSGYEYQKIVEKLLQSQEFDGLNEFVKVVLTLRTRKELDELDKFSVSDKLFYLHDITHTGIFEAILDPRNTKVEESLKIFVNILDSVIKLGSKKDNDVDVFAMSEPFYLLDVDLFTVELDSDKRSHLREDVQNLVTVVKKLVENVFTSACGDQTESQRLYSSYLSSLSDSRTTYRLKLFAVTRCPNLFTNEIEDLLFRLFNVGERYFDIDGGAEYDRALIAGFSVLDNDVKRKYITNVIAYHGAVLDDKDKEGWRKRDGIKVLNYIKAELTKEELALVEEVFGKLPEGEVDAPHPAIGRVISGFVSHKSPINLDEYSVEEIISHLKTDWSPKVLKDQFQNDDFLNPRGAEGLADALKENFRVRMFEYFPLLNKFFDRESIDASYVYALLRQMEDYLRAGQKFDDDQITAVFTFLDLIRVSGEKVEFKRSDERSYLADWIAVHKVSTDLLVDILRAVGNGPLFKANRGRVLSIIKYLLTVKSSPDPEDDKREAEEPFHIAVNSVRGRAYESFIQFTNADGPKLAEDIKAIFLSVLDNEQSNAVRFVMGHYIATLYFKDIDFIRGLAPRIFPNTQQKDRLSFASWEGYLANALYKELYEEFKDYYAYAITLSQKDYPNRKYLKGLDETLAGHLALAYAHFGLAPGTALFDAFWNTPNESRHYEFTSFLGRHYLTKDTAGDKWFEDNKVDKQKLIDFWDWLLTTDIEVETKVFSGFGFWVNPEKEIIPDSILIEKLALTLPKSNGEIDWDYGLSRRIDKFAKINPQRTLEIIESLLILNGEINPHHRMYYGTTHEVKGPLEAIYKIDQFKKPVRNLINSLVAKGGKMFWDLKSIISETQ